MRRKRFDRLTFLFLSLLTVVILSPFLMGRIVGNSILYALAAAACVSTVYGLRLGKRTVIIALILAVLAVVTGVASFFITGQVALGISVLSGGLFYGFLTGLLIRYIVKAEEVTADILYGSVCAYLLIGIVYSAIYAFMDILDPAAFAVSGEATGAAAPGHGDFTYYSFVTLTTLGYGDILPVSRYARTAAFLEAVTGTLYVAILISRLVSLYITHSIMDKRK